MSNNEQKAEASTAVSTLNCYYFRSSGKSHCRYALAPWWTLSVLHRGLSNKIHLIMKWSSE